MIIDFRLFEALAELNSLRDILVTIDDQESHLSELRWKELSKQVESYGKNASEDDWDIVRQQHYYQTEYLYPKAFRSAFIISLWASFEASLIEIAKFIQAKKEIQLKLSDIRGSNIIDQFKKYFEHILIFDLELSDEAWSRLDFLYLLRNSYAHTNGRLEMLKEHDKNRMQKIIERKTEVTEVNGYIIVEMECVYALFGFINIILQKLIANVRNWDDELKAIR
ncbi:hypothetical protein [Cohnella sp. WQ 127256]|uniref:hypothetical protein n=1 Tax=Cohnella sp. WQ 127256 TaxID=2938790 RepID=UPI002118ABA6|nr:hypothetical protein [Cohnella sp. WQ 127256]